MAAATEPVATSVALRRFAWTLLHVLLAALVGGAALYDRAGWETLVPGEATLLMQAESLAVDRDVVYARADFDRLTARWGAEPTDLALVSEDGAPIAFDHPFPLALYLAPFVRLAPRSGFALAQALLLAAAALFVARTLERRVGEAGPLWIALAVFASVAFAYVFLALSAVFLLATTAVGVALIARAEPPPRGVHALPEVYGSDVPPASRVRWLWAGAGAVLALPVAVAPALGLLVGGAWLAAPREHRGRARTAFAAAFLAVLVLQIGVQYLGGGGFHFAGADRFVFTPATGFPLVDFPAAEWTPAVRRLGALHWHEAPRVAFGFDPPLWGWAAVDLVAGRAIGLLPYFAPLLLLAFAGSTAGFRKGLLAGAGAWTALLLVVHPFDVWGGPGAIANRHVLPVYGALWLVLGRPRPSPRAVLGIALLVTALAAPFLLPLWRAPWAPPVVDGDHRHVGEAARRWLPFETTQRWVAGGQIVEHAGLWVRFLGDGGWPETGRGRLMLAGQGPARLHVASGERVDGLLLELGAGAPARIEVVGGELGETFLRPDGGVAFRVRLEPTSRRHAAWWSPLRHDHHLLELRLPGAAGPVPLRLVPEVVVPADAAVPPP